MVRTLVTLRYILNNTGNIKIYTHHYLINQTLIFLSEALVCLDLKHRNNNYKEESIHHP